MDDNIPDIDEQVRVTNPGEHLAALKSYLDREGKVTGGPVPCMRVTFPPREGRPRSRTAFIPLSALTVVPDPKRVEAEELRNQIAALSARLEALTQ
ncbi:hypothetical protein SAMN02983003_0590 [Devosia enhydra]|uniref:Uncharacterized protein n=1 Tax=Devosia enhydra TaxID=665118 RepID=A0A1K2HUB0_9HYPH|nr:hypothetical protein [Devosia enhydra]SFZ81606.1 hypothetical protein SAMN02983003_0590 [Devosia enhydra]